MSLQILRLWLSISLLGIASILAIFPTALFGETDYNKFSEAEKKAWNYLNNAHDGIGYTPYSPPPVPANLSFADRNSEITAFMSDDAKPGLYEFLTDDDFREEWPEIFYRLGVWSTVKPDQNDFFRLKPVVEKIESSSMEAPEKLNYLYAAYGAIGRIDTPEAKAFLRARTSREFWGGTMPEVRSSRPDGPGTSYRSAQEAAIMAYAVRGDDDAVAYLKQLSQKPEIQQEPKLLESIRYAIDSASNRKRVIEQDQAYYHLIKDKPKTSLGEAATKPQTPYINHHLLWITLSSVITALVIIFAVYAFRRRTLR